jgi:hypothetical protein
MAIAEGDDLMAFDFLVPTKAEIIPALFAAAVVSAP